MRIDLDDDELCQAVCESTEFNSYVESAIDSDELTEEICRTTHFKDAVDNAVDNHDFSSEFTQCADKIWDNLQSRISKLIDNKIDAVFGPPVELTPEPEIERPKTWFQNVKEYFDLTNKSLPGWW